MHCTGPTNSWGKCGVNHSTKHELEVLHLLLCSHSSLFNWLRLTMASCCLCRSNLSSGEAKRRRNIPILQSSDKVLTICDIFKMSYHETYTSNCLYGSPILHPRSLPISFQLHSKIDKLPLLKEHRKRF